MSALRITEDILLKELFDLFPHSREILKAYGYSRLIELGIEEVVVDKLSLKGLLKLMGYEEGKAGVILKEIQNSCHKKPEEL